jgi:hypothetical protein
MLQASRVTPHPDPTPVPRGAPTQYSLFHVTDQTDALIPSPWPSVFWAPADTCRHTPQCGRPRRRVPNTHRKPPACHARCAPPGKSPHAAGQVTRVCQGAVRRTPAPACTPSAPGTGNASTSPEAAAGGLFSCGVKRGTAGLPRRHHASGCVESGGGKRTPRPQWGACRWARDTRPSTGLPPKPPTQRQPLQGCLQESAP